jgi:outer membrane protein assembly factor BamD
MKKTTLWLFLAGFIFLGNSCKSEYEKVRVSGDPELILKKAFEYYEAEEYQRAQSLFDLVLNNLRGRPEAEEVYYKYAYTHYYLNQYLLSAYYFKNFSNTFLNSQYREEAAFMSAYSNYKISPIYRLEQSSTQDAIDEFQLFVNLFPQSTRVEQCNELIDELRRKLEKKAFAEGELYFNLRQYQSSVISFDNLLRDYPETPDEERVLFLIAKSSFLLSKNSVVEKKIERYEQTVVRCNDFIEKYGDSKYAKEVKEMLKESNDSIRDVKKLLKIT